jgi:hypothetical protein
MYIAKGLARNTRKRAKPATNALKPKAERHT